MASGESLTGITKANFSLPKLAGSLAAMRQEMLNGKGFILYKGFPVDEWGHHKSAVAYMGLGACKQHPVFFIALFSTNNARRTPIFLCFRRFGLSVLRDVLLGPHRLGKY